MIPFSWLDWEICFSHSGTASVSFLLSSSLWSFAAHRPSSPTSPRFVALTIFTASLPPLFCLYSGFGGTVFFLLLHVLAAQSRQGFYKHTCDWLSTFLVHNGHHTIMLTKSKAGIPPERSGRLPFKGICNKCRFVSCCRSFRFAAAAEIQCFHILFVSQGTCFAC